MYGCKKNEQIELAYRNKIEKLISFLSVIYDMYVQFILRFNLFPTASLLIMSSLVSKYWLTPTIFSLLYLLEFKP